MGRKTTTTKKTEINERAETAASHDETRNEPSARKYKRSNSIVNKEIWKDEGKNGELQSRTPVSSADEVQLRPQIHDEMTMAHKILNPGEKRENRSSSGDM